MKKWTANQIPDLKNKTALITGGNIGLGYQITLELARKNAAVVIACRTISKGEAAIEKMEQELDKKIKASVIALDLTDIMSVQDCAITFAEKHQQLNLLINNAGVVNLKTKQSTATGLEMHMATNHLGHFALTGLLYPIIAKTPNARVVTMSSGAHRSGNINFNDLNWVERPYGRLKSYGDSKLANLMFTLSLQEKFDSENTSALSLAAHPGLSATERQQSIGIGGWISKMLAQPVWKGALSALRAATDPNAKPKEYYGPQYGVMGYPTIAKMHPRAFNKTVANKLWDLSESITGIKF
jgi:NAD(P)-dependent dehydrogenase (short-subunit alcohol dehydrogenase family)